MENWYDWSDGTEAKSSGLPPDRTYENIPFALVKYWRAKIGNTPLKLTPGRHKIRVAFTASPSQESRMKPIRVISNMVEIEIVPHGTVQ